jgi:hypothetical protein
MNLAGNTILSSILFTKSMIWHPSAEKITIEEIVGLDEIYVHVPVKVFSSEYLSQ